MNLKIATAENATDTLLSHPVTFFVLEVQNELYLLTF